MAEDTWIFKAAKHTESTKDQTEHFHALNGNPNNISISTTLLLSQAAGRTAEQEAVCEMSRCIHYHQEPAAEMLTVMKNCIVLSN